MDQKFVNLVPGTLQVEMDKDMNLFDVVNWSLDYTSDAKETVEMKVRLKRKPKSELLTTFLPTILLTSITFATSFFKPFFFEAALSVNLTTMLVMTTIFISKMESLPPTSDTKMIDIWLIICQLVPFSEVVLLTAIEYLRADDDGSADIKVLFHLSTALEIFAFFQVDQLGSNVQTKTEKLQPLMSSLKFIGRSFSIAIFIIYHYPF